MAPVSADADGLARLVHTLARASATANRSLDHLAVLIKRAPRRPAGTPIDPDILREGLLEESLLAEAFFAGGPTSPTRCGHRLHDSRFAPRDVADRTIELARGCRVITVSSGGFTTILGWL